MGRTIVHILGQVERKRKYFWSCGTNRLAGASILAKVVTLLLFLCLVYSVFCGVLYSRSDGAAGVDYSGGSGSELLPKTTNSVGNHRSEFMKADDDYRELRTVNISRSNMLNGIDTNSVVIGTLKPSQAGRLAVIFHKLVVISVILYYSHLTPNLKKLSQPKSNYIYDDVSSTIDYCK